MQHNNGENNNANNNANINANNNTNINKKTHFKRRRSAMLGICKRIVNKLPITNKTFGLWVRAFHYTLPFYLFIFISLNSRRIANACIFFLLIIVSLYIYYRACFLSLMEIEFCRTDDNISDCVLETFNYEISGKNRYIITPFVFICYIACIAFVYYFRFISVL